ncbi:MAG TPA: RAMP superfamily CRISPR-associated protein [Herpetosiphonaceae bacterium]
MHKQLLNEAILEIAIRPDGPLLIKAGETGGLDPTHPDMEFVRTLDRVFLPGSSLKGVLRAHSERIVRSLQAQGEGRGACDPLKRGESCGDRLERLRLESDEKYRQSCCICRLFGSTVVASRVRFADALPVGEVAIEERNGVAIDRVFGSVAVGPFNYEVVTSGVFRTSILFKNVTLAQLALVGLALRDVGEGRVGIGFGKSRGLGRVAIDWGRLTIRYPLADLRQTQPDQTRLCGVGALIGAETRAAYGVSAEDWAELPEGLGFESDGWGSLTLVAEGSAQVQELFRRAVGRWREEVQGG